MFPLHAATPALCPSHVCRPVMSLAAVVVAGAYPVLVCLRRASALWSTFVASAISPRPEPTLLAAAPAVSASSDALNPVSGAGAGGCHVAVAREAAQRALDLCWTELHCTSLGRPGCESCHFDSCDTIIITMVAGRARQATGTAAVVNHNGASLLASCLAVTVVTCSLPFASAAIRVA